MRIVILAILAMAIVMLVYVAAMVFLVSDCGAQGCEAKRWQQTTVTSCTCWYKCGGRCERAGAWDGGGLKCTCPVISSCGNEITGQAVPKPTPTIPTVNTIRVNPTPQPKLPTMGTCPWPWYPGGSLYIDEIRTDPVYGDTWKCSTGGKLVEVKQDIEAAETLIVERKRWPGGFRGCFKVYGSGWHLSRGECVKAMKVCVYPSAYAGGVEQRAVIDAKDSCDRY